MDVPDVLPQPGADIELIFCGINPGRVSAAARAHFANPRNDFWRLLHDAGFTPRLFDPQEQFSLLELGIGVTNAAHRTTPGSGDLRRGDFDGERLARVAEEFHPVCVAFVGKEAYRGAFNERPELGPQLRTIGRTALYVLPSTSPANAAVPYAERLEWFTALKQWLVPTYRPSARAVVVDDAKRVLLVQFQNAVTKATWWATPGGGIEEGESHEEALRRELAEEIGLHDFELGPFLWSNRHTIPWAKRLVDIDNAIYLVRVREHEAVPTIDVEEEGVAGFRWWTLEEMERTDERLAPPDLVERVRTILGA